MKRAQAYRVGTQQRNSTTSNRLVAGVNYLERSASIILSGGARPIYHFDLPFFAVRC